MKRLLAIGAISVLGALMIGSAAALQINNNGGTLQQATVSATCDTDGVDLVLNFATDVDSATVSGIDVTAPAPSCLGRTLKVELLAAAGAPLGAVATDCQGTIPVSAAGSETIVFSGPCDIVLLQDSRVTIY